MGDADLDTLVTRFLRHRNFAQFVRELCEEGHSGLLPPELVNERRKLVAKAKFERAKREYEEALKT